MKRNAIARIVIYSILAVVLIGILVSFLVFDGFLFDFGNNGGTIVEHEGSVPASDIQKLEIDWVSGSVTIRRGDTDQIIFSESAPENSKYKMVYAADGNTLRLSYGKGKVSFGFGDFSIPSKDLTVTVPQDWDCEALEIEGASLTIQINHLKVDTLELDGASCDLRFTGDVRHVEVDGASTDLYLECTSRPTRIDMDGASCELDLVLPKDCGFALNMDGISCDLRTDLPYTTKNDQQVYGDGHCKINIDGVSCDVIISESSECAHVWDDGTLQTVPGGSEQRMVYTCTLCGETRSEPVNNAEDLYKSAVSLLLAGKKNEAAITFAKLGDYLDAHQRSLQIWAEIRTNTTLITHGALLVGIRSDGSIITHSHLENPYPQIENWTNMHSLASGQSHIVGLTADGTVKAIGDNTFGQCNVENWTNIVAIDCGSHFTAGLKADGTVMLAGSLPYGIDAAANWTDIVMLEAAGNNLIGLRYDGTAVALGDQNSNMCAVPEWTDIIDIYLDNSRAAYLRADGSIQIFGNRLYIDDQQISGLVTVETDGNYLAGMRQDGTMYFEGYNADISDKGEIVAIVDYAVRKLGLRSDGTLVEICMYSESAAETPSWTNMMIP